MANIPAAHMRQFTPENLDDIETVVVETDLLIIGGGNAGCFVATEAALVDPNVRVTIMEKAEIMRSGACSAGMDAIRQDPRRPGALESCPGGRRSPA